MSISTNSDFLEQILILVIFFITDSTKSRMKTEEKSNVPKVRIAVIGNTNVGKSALTVRYLTRRFIGEYRSNTDLLYKQTLTLECGVFDVEIVDISAENDDSFPLEQIQWADACLIVYSITDRQSYDYAIKSLGELRQMQNSPSAYLVANKADLDHLREVIIFFKFY
jgi:Ras-related and estrogen-regulated growth inhibitor-like protein